MYRKNINNNKNKNAQGWEEKEDDDTEMSIPLSFAIFFIINSAIGERQILPWQTKFTFIILFISLSTILLFPNFKGI